MAGLYRKHVLKEPASNEPAAPPLVRIQSAKKSDDAPVGTSAN
jgi:hypothetical protein